MLQIRNHTNLTEPNLSIFPDRLGVETLYLVVKATFDISPRTRLSEEQPPICLQDAYWQKPGESSLRYASFVHIGKAATDIILTGHAYTPNGSPQPYTDVSLGVGHQQMDIAVFGDRYWQNGRISEPAPFVTLPLTYENAYGGTYIKEQRKTDGELVSTTEAEARNPVGKGFIGSRKPEACEGIALPNLEDPRQLIQTLQDKPEPVAFGYIAPNWEPRKQFAGTYDEHWRKQQAPYLPADFDHRFFCMGHNRLNSGRFLQGGEPVYLNHLSPESHLQFKVPYCPLAVTVSIGNDKKPLPLAYDTLLIEPDVNRFAVVWRGSLACDKQMLKIRAVDVNYRKQTDAERAL